MLLGSPRLALQTLDVVGEDRPVEALERQLADLVGLG